MVEPIIVEGDILDRPVDAIVNAWNRNIIPWWLLLPQGLAGAIKRRAGLGPYIELGRHGAIPLGGAILTGAGRLPHKAIIHVAGIDMLWRSSPEAIQGSVRSAMALVAEHGFDSIAFPVIGAGVGGFSEADALRLMREALAAIAAPARVEIVLFRPGVR